MADEIGKVINVSVEEEMKKSYIDYSMSVIVGRALPDVRDGLKPIHRRILYAMNGLGLTPDKAYRKSATIVGEVMGNYHPHGDTAIYDAMVRLAQDFSTRYMLVDGHGNFGSLDGDPPAAMRYTEARMSKTALEMLTDLNKDTVDFIPNFDGRLKEPAVLPSRFPNLLVNGSSGIAVGMATNIPPHNLTEVIDGVIMMIENPEVTIEELMNVVKGPDFPTGGIIMGKSGIRGMYEKGRGSIVMRAKTNIEQIDNRQKIVITEIPYLVNKSRLVEKIADLVRDKTIEGISDLRDESDRAGTRIVIDVKRDGNANIILNQLYKRTQLQDTFGAIMLALVDNKPRVLNLKQMLYYYLKHQEDVIVRRTRYDLSKALERVHILEGLRIALSHIDEVIDMIKKSKDVPTAKAGLMNRFNLTEKQTQVILEMRLQRLTALERHKIDEEYDDLVKKIAYYNKVLSDKALVLGIIKEELIEVRRKFGDERRTRISAQERDIDIEDLIAEEDVVITMTHFGYVKRLLLSTYKSQRRGGRGITGITTREKDFVEQIFVATTHHVILFFTDKGYVYKLKAYEIPEAGRTARGTAIVNLLPLEPGERINAVISIRDFEDANYLFFATKSGIVKKTLLSKYASSRRNGLIAINLLEDDELIAVRLVDKHDHVILGTVKGKGIRFPVDDVRFMGRTARGVKGISLRKGDSVVSMDILKPDQDVLVVTEKGFGKRTSQDDYRIQSRAGKGVIIQKVTEKTGTVNALRLVSEKDDLMLCTASGIIIRMKASGISKMSRNTIGVTLIRLEKGDTLASVAVISED
jgi:DNA gyrase subunit A